MCHKCKNMIHSISCKNFYSFGELASLSFVVNEHAPNNHGYFIAPSGTRLSKVAVVIGSNASGKTNLLKVFAFMRWFIFQSFEINPEDEIPVRKFMFNGYKDKPVEFSAVFEIDADIYTYSFSLDGSKVLREELKLTGKINEKKSKKLMFSRVWDNKEKKYSLKGTGFGLPKGIQKLIRSNASIISVATRLNHEKSQKMSLMWKQIVINIKEDGYDHSQIKFGVPAACVFFSENKILKKKAEKLLASFDLGLSGFEITENNVDNHSSYKVVVSHSFDGQTENLPISYESSGTKLLFILMMYVLQALANGSIAVLDELDTHLHPEMVISLLELFLEPETNTKNAQLLFSTHSHSILNRLDKYQIFLVEKNNKGISESWRLDEMDGIRSDENYFSKYISGAYGAYPRI